MKNREYILKSLKEELIGPGSEGIDGGNPIEEVIFERPSTRYKMGILYPGDKNSQGETDGGSILGDVEEVDSDGDYNAGPGKQSAISTSDSMSNQFKPSTMGLTCYISRNTPKIFISVDFGLYDGPLSEPPSVMIDSTNKFLTEKKYESLFEVCGEKLLRKRGIGDLKDKEFVKNVIDLLSKQDKSAFWLTYKKLEPQKSCFRRRQISISMNLDIMSLTWGKNSFKLADSQVEEYPLELLLIKHEYSKNDPNQKLSVILLNSKEENEESNHCFQVELSIKIIDGNFVDFRKISIDGFSDLNYDLLYRNKQTFAVGHGCSVMWVSTPPNEISTSFMPIYEVPKVDFEVIGITNEALNMKYLATNTKDEVNQVLKSISDQYNKWIQKVSNDISSLPNELQETANNNLNACNLSLTRINLGIQKLRDDKVFKAFQFMNRAMWLQRYHSVNFIQNESKFEKGENYFEAGIEYSWRPFQIAFILLNIEALTEKNSVYRDIVDLIWFPTGGGKTEAYLGLIAFEIFYNKIINPKVSGTRAIMRYTLRLLTAQQFQRASTMILACEFIRKSNDSFLGDTPISIGLWVGGINTPNTTAEAERILQNKSKIKSYPQIFQVLQCPWCAMPLVENKISGFRMQKIKNRNRKKFYITCINSSCDFHNDTLPVQVVDEELYKNPPTLLFATADKFAQMVDKADSRAFFGMQNGGTPPGLVIQDEMHLISSSLGSIYAAYETVIDFFCSQNGVKPKIIAATATIRDAAEQMKMVFNRKTNIFPPSGIDAEDSFFFKELKVDDKNPGRLYLGLMTAGTTMTTAQVNLFSALLYHKSLPGIEKTSEEQIDKIYTLIAYFNSIKELGKANSLFADDIGKSRVEVLKARRRSFVEIDTQGVEITSRSSDDIVHTLKSLEKNYTLDDNSAISYALTTNMFSVGVDISRLNLMVVTNQPKTNSEYIQATSRIGRKDPGLVVTLFDTYRPRDRSYFENFLAFHQSYYRFVEPTSVVPFSLPVRKRVFSSLLVIFKRFVENLTENTIDDDYKNKLNGLILNDFVDFLKARIREIDPEEEKFMDGELLELNKELLRFLQKKGNKKFLKKENPFNKNEESDYLLKFNQLDPGEWTVMSSFRNVENEIFCDLEPKR